MDKREQKKNEQQIDQEKICNVRTEIFCVYKTRLLREEKSAHKI